MMDSENVTVVGNLTKGFAMEVVFSHHCPALFGFILGSLILGLPLAWNILWHLKESVCVCVCMILSTWYTGSSKKNLAKFSDTCSVRADGLRIGSPRLVSGRKAGN